MTFEKTIDKTNGKRSSVANTDKIESRTGRNTHGLAGNDLGATLGDVEAIIKIHDYYIETILS